MSTLYKRDKYTLFQAKEHYARTHHLEECQVHWNCTHGGWELWHPGYSTPSPEPEPQQHFQREHELYPWLTDGDFDD